MKRIQPVLVPAVFALVVGMACAMTGGEATVAAPSSTAEVVPASPTPADTALPPTETLPATEAPPPTETQPAAPRFFREEFDPGAVLENWNSFSLGTGKDGNLVIRQEDDHLLFDLGDEDLYVYYIYTPFEYDDVSIRLNAENRGRNNNNISLVCRMNSEGSQWYEFSVESGGLWYLYAVDEKYNVLANGGTTALRQGREVNEYGMTCQGDEIILSVNQEEVRRITDTTYGFDRGLVGFNISSLNVLPITVEVNWFEISQP